MVVSSLWVVRLRFVRGNFGLEFCSLHGISETNLPLAELTHYFQLAQPGLALLGSAKAHLRRLFAR